LVVGASRSQAVNETSNGSLKFDGTSSNTSFNTICREEEAPGRAAHAEEP
jgi:hypothetical protein